MKHEQTARRGEVLSSPKVMAADIRINTPQQDKDWSEDQKIEWVKTETRRLVKAFDPRNDTE